MKKHVFISLAISSMQLSAQEPLKKITTQIKKQTAQGKAETADKQEGNKDMYLVNACISGNLDEVKRWVKAGAKINNQNVFRAIQIPEWLSRSGLPPLVEASRAGHLDIVKFLVEHGAYVNFINYQGFTPLMAACSANHLEIAKYLLEHGADVNQKDSYHKTAYNYASDDAVKELLKAHGASTNPPPPNPGPEGEIGGGRGRKTPWIR